jgi:hypothetical protein
MNEPNAPATKADLVLLLTSTKTDLNEAVERLQNEFKEAIHDSQPLVLKAIYAMTQSFDAKIMDFETSDHHIRQRLTVVESRITEIERRLNIHPVSVA